MLSSGRLEVQKLEDLNWLCHSIREAGHAWEEVDDFLTENPDMMQELEVDRSKLTATAAFLISLSNRAKTLKAAATDQLAQKLTEGSQQTLGGGQSSNEQVNTQAAPAKAKALLCKAPPTEQVYTQAAQAKAKAGFDARRRQHNWSTLLKPRLCYYARRRPRNMSTLQAHRQKPRLYCCARRRQHNVFSLMWGPGFRIHRTRFESAGSFANVGASARLAAHCLPCLKKGVRREGNGQSHNLICSPLKYLLQK